MRVYRNDGPPENPVFTLIDDNLLGYTLDLAAPFLVDIDNDNDYDMFVGDGNGNLGFYRNIGDSLQYNFVLEIINVIGIWEFDPFPVLIDIDHDEDYDLFAGGGGRLVFFRNIGTPEIFNFVLEADTFGNIYNSPGNCYPTFCDIDGDEDSNLFFGEVDRGLNFYRNLEYQSSPQVSLILTPHNLPIQIPPGSGSFRFDVEIVNDDTVDYIIDALTDATLPNGSTYPIILRENINLPAGGTIARDALTQFVPARAIPSVYSYNACVRDQATMEVLAVDSFAFEKLPGMDTAAHDFGWELFGWDFSGEAQLSTVHPSSFILHPSYPNPFNPETVISLELPAASFVNLVIYDIQGRKVARLVDGLQPAGVYEAAFDGSRFASGVYFARLTAGDFSQTRKLLLLK